MNNLVAYILNHLILDFSGDLTVDGVRSMLSGDESPQARALLAKVTNDNNPEDMVLALVDCLQEFLPSGINADVVGEQLKIYTES